MCTDSVVHLPKWTAGIGLAARFFVEATYQEGFWVNIWKYEIT